MQKVQKYRKAIELLQAEECKPSPQMMFKLSQTLDLDLLLEQADIERQAKQIRALEQRIQYIREEQEESDENYMEELKIQEYIPSYKSIKGRRDLICPFENCLKVFKKESTFKCHQQLCHKESLPWKGPFKLTLSDDL